MPTVLLIPAYRPGPELPRILQELVPAKVFNAMVLVDDGSGPEYSGVFAVCPAVVLRHPHNLGKGAALRTGMAHVLSAYPDCSVVTADADGQHHADDIVAVAKRLEREPDSLVLGARQFDGTVPDRSRLGNQIAGIVFHLLVGRKLKDTQTGLRGIPRHLMEDFVSIPASRYEFELAMLTAAKHRSIPIVEEPIRTIYEPGNPTSHFNPWKDSMRIGFVLTRFTMLSLATAILDNLVFYVGIRAGLAIGWAQVGARSVAVAVNYPLARRAVFLSQEPHKATLSRYLALVAASGFASFQLLTHLQTWLGLSVLEAKMMAESALFLVNFLVQRDVVFVRRRSAPSVPCDGYLKAMPPRS